MPLAASQSRSWTILAILSLASGPFQLMNGWMAPYSCGGLLKFAATSRTEGTVICCHGLWAGRTAASSGMMASLLSTFFIKPLLVLLFQRATRRTGPNEPETDGC